MNVTRILVACCVTSVGVVGRVVLHFVVHRGAHAVPVWRACFIGGK